MATSESTEEDCPSPHRRPYNVTPIEGTTKTSAAYAELRSRILDGTLPPGSALNQEVLASAMAISVTPLREALRRLEGEGLVEMRSAKFARVVPLTARELRDLRTVRLSLDPLAASLAALNHRENEVQRLLASSDLPRFTNLNEWHAAHFDFHNSIWEMSTNTVLADTLRRLWHRLDRYRLLALSDQEFDYLSGVPHAQIAQAICTRNGALAASLAAAHLNAMEETDVLGDAPSRLPE
ncbi:MAG: GntR family transcriptional regulator [Candidatus Dormiibacterota bacterium]